MTSKLSGASRREIEFALSGQMIKLKVHELKIKRHELELKKHRLKMKRLEALLNRSDHD